MIFRGKNATVIDVKRSQLPESLRKDVETIERVILHAAMEAAENPMPVPRKRKPKKKAGEDVETIEGAIRRAAMEAVKEAVKEPRKRKPKKKTAPQKRKRT